MPIFLQNKSIEMLSLEKIIYAYAIPSWLPNEITPFQGFAPGLVPICPMFVMPCRLPSDISEFTMDAPDMWSRRRAGAGNLFWSPINVDTLIRFRKPTSTQPFLVVFSADREVARQISSWRRNLRIRPLHVSVTGVGGSISPVDLTLERLKTYCLTALRQACESNRRLDVADCYDALEHWRTPEERHSSLRLHSHNVTLPNQMVLVSAGEKTAEGEGALEASPHQDYINAISESARAVLAYHTQTEDRPIYRVSPPRPDVILFAPAAFRGMTELFSRAEGMPTGAKKILRALDRQRGYTIETSFEEGEQDKIEAILSLRGGELKLQSLAVGLMATSTFAATIRLPPAVNRTAGVVGQLAKHLRHYDDLAPGIKTARVFKAVQDALVQSIPAQHIEIIKESRTGIKIISNAPIEWLPIDGVPLGIRADVSRINVTPGNIMIEQLRSLPPIYIASANFKNYLTVSMYEDGDRIANHIAAALEVLPGAEGLQITGERVCPSTVEEFIEAVNSYKGPILIIDSHGDHPEDSDVGGLIIGGQHVDVWSLKERIKFPPIVILSACDTQPFDRSHATVANGLLHCGALAVLGTALPIRARDAAIFLVRLMLRAITFGDIMNGMGQSVAWTNIVSGALRMQLASDIVRGLSTRGMIPEDSANNLQFQANQDLNPLRADWFERLGERCRAVGEFDEARWGVVFNEILAASDVIRYVHMGNPESILISDSRVTQRAINESGATE